MGAARFLADVAQNEAASGECRSLAMEELFPGFDFESVGLAKRMSSLKGGLTQPDDYVEPSGEDP